MDTDLQPRRPDDSVGDLLNDITTSASTLVRNEVELAKVELREDVRDAIRGAALFSVAGVAGAVGGLFLLIAAALGIATAIGEGWQWLGFVIVATGLLLVAGIAAVVGKQKADEATPPAPRATKQLNDTRDAMQEIIR